MKPAKTLPFPFFRRAVPFLVLGLSVLASAARAGDFRTDSPADKNGLTIKYRGTDGRDHEKVFSANKPDRSLAGTGWEGSVQPLGDHWKINVNGGALTGRIYSESGIEIFVGPNCAAELVNRSSGPVVSGGMGIRFTGGGAVRIGLLSKGAEGVVSGGGNIVFRNVTLGIASLNPDAKAVLTQSSTESFGEVVVDHAVLRIAIAGDRKGSTGGIGIRSSEGGLSIDGKSDVTIVTPGCAVETVRKQSGIAISGSKVRLISTQDSAISSGIESRQGGNVSVANSVFYAFGAESGVLKRGYESEKNGTLKLTNVDGLIAGNDRGVAGFNSVSVGGDTTALRIVGNLNQTFTDAPSFSRSTVKGAAVALKENESFTLSGGNLVLSSPSVCGLICGVVKLEGGNLLVSGRRKEARVVDWKSLLDDSVWGGSRFGRDSDFGEIKKDEAAAKAVAAFWTALKDKSSDKTQTGIYANEIDVKNANAEIESRTIGIWLASLRKTPLLSLSGGKTGGSLTVRSDGVGITDEKPWNRSYSKEQTDDGTRIRVSGGTLSAAGTAGGIVIGGKVEQNGGTIQVSVAGGVAESGDGALLVAVPKGKDSTPMKLWLEKPHALCANGGFGRGGGKFSSDGPVHPQP